MVRLGMCEKDIPSLSGTAWGKDTRNQRRKEKASMTPMPPLLEDEYSETRNLMPPYITPRRTNDLKLKNPKQIGVPLIMPLVPKGVKLLMDSIPNLRKLSFIDHDTKKHKGMDCKKYMDTIQETLDGPNKFVAKEWARGLE